MILPSCFRLLLLFAIGGLLGSLTQARPIHEIWRFMMKGIHAPNAVYRRHSATELDQMAVFDSPRPHLPKVDAPMKLEKRFPPPTRPGHDSFNMQYYLHKNVSHVYQQSIQDLMRKAAALQKNSKPEVSVKTEERWVHPGFEWIHIFGTPIWKIVVYNNVTCADKVEIFKRIRRAAEFEKSTKEPGVSGIEEHPGKDDKVWFDQNFDHMKVVPTPKQPLFVPANTTESRKTLIHQAVLVVMRSYGEGAKRKGWFDNGDRYGALLKRERDCYRPVGEEFTHENC